MVNQEAYMTETGTETAVPDYPRGVTFEQVWAMLVKSQEETDRKVKENDRIIQEMREESKRAWEKSERWLEDSQKAREKSERESKEWKEESERWSREWKEKSERESREWKEKSEQESREWKEESKKLSKQMGDLGRSFGEMAEHLVAPGISERFNELGYNFGLASQGTRIFSEDRKKVLTEIDLLLENSSCLLAAEVKSKPTEKDIAHHIGRLEILRDFRKRHQEKPKRILGAIAGAVFPEASRQAAIEAGLYVVVQSGDTMKINVPEDFKPREW
ncbi:hypothetical protein FACS189461_2050 [Spirochaetia bacterium]|nr:hypothetical protein FACS189461_2050 [Spirochaetia bacterium]